MEQVEAAVERQDANRPNQQVGVRSPPPFVASSAHTAPLEIGEALLPKAANEAGDGAWQHPFSLARRRYLVGLISVITALLCADQNLLAPNLTAAAAYFGLDEQQKDIVLGGYLMAAFFLVGAPAALICGYLADKHNRIHLLTAIIVIGEAPCLATYWVTELWQFFLVRMLTGIAVGGCFPLVFSLLGDLFPISQRAAMAALVQIAVGAGIGGGQMLAGLIGPATNWRMPFVVMAAPSLLLAGVLWATGREPPRGGFEAALADQLASGEAYSEAISWAKVRQLLRLPSNCIIILQGLPGCLPWGVMQTYINDYLHLSKGFSIEMATLVILLFGIGCGAGVIAGGAAGQALYNWRKESMPLLTGLSVLAGAAPVLYLVNADLQAAGLGVSLLMAALAGFLVSIAGPNLRAIMINVNVPETRGVALALQSVTDDLGRGLGPVIVAGFISRLGRQGAFNLAVAGWVPCGLLLLGLVGTMRRDEALQQARLASSKAPGRGSGALREVRVQAPASPPSLASSLGGCEPGPDPAGLGPSGSRHALLSHTQPRSSSSSSNRAALPQPALPGELPSSALGEGGAASCSERQLLLLGEAGGGGSSGGAASGQGGCSGRGAQPGSAGSRGRWLAALLPRQQQQQQHGQQERCSDPGGLAHGGAPQCCQQQAGGRPERGLCSSSGGACACALTEARQRACRSSSAGRGGGEDGGSGSKAGGPVGECCEGGERSSLLPAPPRLGGSSSSLGSSSVRRCQSDGAACVA